MVIIMMLTSQYTGRGHMSIAQALSEQFAQIPDVELDVVDGFIFMGSRGVQMSKMYNVVTQHTPEVWKAAYNATQGDGLVPDLMGYLVKRRLDSYVRETQPDMILTVHPMFVGSVIDALERSGLDVPVVCMEADIVNIHSSWCDPRVLMAICPTREAWECSVELGMPEEKLITIGFPTRGDFCRAAREGSARQYDPSRTLKCLLTGGGGGAGDMEEYATSLMRDTDASLTVVCGSNERLREHLQEKLGEKYAGRINIRGFVTEMEKLYAEADVSLCRASPNCMFEAVVMGVPMIITGALPGQEKDNPRFAQEHNLGIICETPDEVGEKIKALTAEDGRLFNEICASQQAYRNLDSAKQIAEYVYSLTQLNGK